MAVKNVLIIFVSIPLQAHSSFAFITRAVRGTRCGVTHSVTFVCVCVSNHGKIIYKIISKLRLSDSHEACWIVDIKLNMLDCVNYFPLLNKCQFFVCMCEIYLLIIFVDSITNSQFTCFCNSYCSRNSFRCVRFCHISNFRSIVSNHGEMIYKINSRL